jgi:hypothetical protein
MGEGADDRDRRPPSFNKSVKKGATIGMVVGWLAALIYVFVSFPIPFGFQPDLQTKIDVILLTGPVLGAAVGAAVGWFLRDSNWREVTKIEGAVLPPGTTNRRAVNWGWKAGTVAGIFLGQYYIQTHSPLGFYTGSIVLVFVLIVPLCAGLGAGIGWLSTNKIDGLDRS